MDEHDKTTDTKKKSNVFDIYSAKRRERRSGDGGGTEEPDYYACGISLSTEDSYGREEWLRFHGEIEGQYSSIDMIRYKDIVRIYCPVPELICIMGEHVTYTLEGQHLDVIAVNIQDRILRSLYLFEPERYPEPDEETPVIFSMVREDIGDEAFVDTVSAETPAQ